MEQALAGHSMSREDIGLSAKDVVLISVNRLAADKGVDKIITALGMIVQQVPQVKLIIIGSGYQEKELLEMIVQKGLTKHVRHFKNVLEEDLYQYYRISDIYLCAFSYPSNISVLEAMACSLPVITTAQPWLIQGQNGLFIENNHPVTICQAVLKLIEQKIFVPGEMSRNISLDYDWPNVVKKAMGSYEQIMIKGRPDG